MPGIPSYDPLDPTANLRRTSGVSVAFVDAYGKATRARLSGLGAQDLAVGENSRMTEAMGEASNMGAYGWEEDRQNFIQTSDAEVYDETYASAENVLYMVFQNNDFDVINVEIPAPKAALLAADGRTLRSLPADSADDDDAEGIIRELIASIENVINTSFLPVNSFSFQRGVRRSRKTSAGGRALGRPQVVSPPSNTGTGTG